MKILILFFIVLGSVCHAELRTWTAVNGKEVEAEFVSNEKVLLWVSLLFSAATIISAFWIMFSLTWFVLAVLMLITLNWSRYADGQHKIQDPKR